MRLKDRLSAIARDERVRYALFLLGCALIVLAPIVSPLPGPGGIVLFAIGASLALRNSHWAKKRYVAFKKRHPKYGEWADWSLRRASAKRRAEIARDQATESD
ncbi:hypothetical protein [Sphingomonas sp. LaA6.9]|uniref:hypothetical protein n=1 Tax=Sphingomonas sp. LaA6.9 TaxID=2919914 RepID=UPI001F4FA0CD|nr:hypothetical protein [Sphingomonas sp. LaA6.9]MCJ8157470.1 hypothetical protein [Sphingomonas sp. LaA6.9]